MFELIELFLQIITIGIVQMVILILNYLDRFRANYRTIKIPLYWAFSSLRLLIVVIFVSNVLSLLSSFMFHIKSKTTSYKSVFAKNNSLRLSPTSYTRYNNNTNLILFINNIWFLFVIPSLHIDSILGENIFRKRILICFIFICHYRLVKVFKIF